MTHAGCAYSDCAEPASHTVHDEPPGVAEYEPGAHCVQTRAPGADANEPAAHAKHAVGIDTFAR